MTCCLNPACHNPPNPDRTMFCYNCGAGLVVLRNRYRPIKSLGGGGFGKTYLAEDIDKLNEHCVIKQFAPQVQGTAALNKATELFEQEAKRLQQLGKHPQIPTLLAYFNEDNRLYLVQEFIDGQNLLVELQQQGIFDEQKIKELLLDLLDILKIVHQQQVIHRDIKPENIIRHSDGKFVLIDFGASKQLTATVMTQIGTTIGSLGYAPLEQMQGGEAYPASDLYSLGATCFHLLSGIHPWDLWKRQGYSWVASWREHLQQPVNQNLGRILDKLLQEEHQQRYQSATEVLQALNSQPIPVTVPVTLPIQQTQPAISGSLKKPIPKHFIVLPLLILIGAGTVYSLQGITNSVENYNRQGIEKYNNQDFRGAIEDYNEAIKINPNFAKAYYNRGNAHYDLGEKQEAIEDYNQAIKLNSKYAEAYYQHGLLEQDNQKAIDYFRQAAELFVAQGSQGDAKRSQGQVRSLLKDYQGAIAAYTEAIGLNSNDLKAYINRGVARGNLGEHQAAIADYNQAIKINPKFALAYNNRGAAHSNLEKKQAAIEDFNQAIRINPNFVLAYNNRGFAYYELGDKQAAIADYNQALKIDPNYADAYKNRGSVRYDLGDNQAAIEDFNQALKINPNYADAYIRRGVARSALGNKQAAIEDYTQAITINPNYALVYNNRGIARSDLGDNKAAIEDYNQALKINPKYADAYINRGVARSALGDKQTAIEDYTQAITINPNYALAYNNRGNARSALGDKQAAIIDFRKSADLYKQQGKESDYQDALNRIKQIEQ
ncbi:tetratricopeptide repeat protein [Nostoc calcicola FACHB-3891]|nr:tetratricopeptide repeat protein [Nostoc calcicola FACHB-3891]